MHLGIDKNGKKIYIGMTVNVPDPNETDNHNHAFVGTVFGPHGTDLITVEDQEGACFDIEPDRLDVDDSE